MSRKESDPRSPRPEPGAVLPPELAEFLRGTDYACLFQGTDQGTVAVVKLPTPEIRALRGPIPIHIGHELYDHPAAPVIRTVITVFDRPEAPLAMETYTNVEDPQQRAEFAQLGTQDHLLMLVFDDQLTERVHKRVGYRGPELAAPVLEQAQQLFERIPQGQFDFDRAKAEIIAQTQL